MIRGNGLRNTMEPTRRAAGISPEVFKMMALAGGSGWALSREGGTSPRSVFFSGKCAITNQRVEVQGRWRVAQGLVNKVGGGGNVATRLMQASATTAGNSLPRMIRGGGGVRASDVRVRHIVDRILILAWSA